MWIAFGRVFAHCQSILALLCFGLLERQHLVIMITLDFCLRDKRDSKAS
jgi:hypothetical protein